MACPITMIYKFINEYKSINTEINVEDFRKKIYDDFSIMTKYYEEDTLLLAYHKFDLPAKTQMEKDCRSLIIDMKTLQIVSYTCPTPIVNNEAQQFLLNNNELELEIQKCYEGTIISLFYHNDKWYVSTRRSLDSSKSIWNGTNYYDMFMDVLKKDNLTFDEFVSKLDKNKGYYFILIHHLNLNVIKYELEFGNDYTKLCLAFVRNKENQQLLNDYYFNYYNNIFKAENISMDLFSQQNNELKTDINMEGVIIKTIKDDREYLLKLQTLSYQFCKAIGPESNILKGYLFLYKLGILKEYIENNKEHQHLDKIVNPYNPNESFDTIGVIDCVYKVFTSELFELYKMMWKLNNGQHLNLELYNILPKEYKDVFYALRGIYYKIRNGSEKKLFGIKDIYQYLKSIDVEHMCALIRQRKLMLNLIILNKDNKNLEIFKKISNYCDKVHIKLISIFTNKLYPDIMPNDVPQIKLQ